MEDSDQNCGVANRTKILYQVLIIWQPYYGCATIQLVELAVLIIKNYIIESTCLFEKFKKLSVWNVSFREWGVANRSKILYQDIDNLTTPLWLHQNTTGWVGCFNNKELHDRVHKLSWEIWKVGFREGEHCNFEDLFWALLRLRRSGSIGALLRLRRSGSIGAILWVFWEGSLGVVYIL